MGIAIQKYLKWEEDKSFSVLYKTYYAAMLKVARYYMNGNELADDMVSEVFAKLWEKRIDIPEIKDIKSYLFTMIKRRCLDEIGKSRYKNHTHLENLEPGILINYKDPEAEYINKELADRIQLSFQKLPDKCRTVFLLVKEDQLKYKEVAELLNISEKTVEMHVGNALKAIRKDLESFVIPRQKGNGSGFKPIINFIVALF